MSGKSHLMAALVMGCLGLCPVWAGPDASAAGPEDVMTTAAARAGAPGAADNDNADTAFDRSLVEDLADGRLDSRTLADAALVASGINDEAALTSYSARLRTLVGVATSRVERIHAPVRRARRLLEELHRTALRRYEASTDRFTDLIDTGAYNCVSASLLYIIAARQVGLDVAAAETPVHVFVELNDSGRRIDIEATSPEGFDVRRDLADFRTFLLANKYATPEDLAQRGVETIFNEFNNLTHPVSPEHALAFLYHNAGVRALQSGHAEEAARDFVNAVRIYPRLGYRSDDLRKTLAWSVREQYDAGDYAGAFRVAEVSMRMFPDRTTVRERFIAVGARAAEDAAGRGEMAAAEEYEARTAALLSDADSRRKLETYTAPVMARAALQARDWPAARRHAERFRAASTDSVEADRFVTWVESRIAEATSGTGSAAEVGRFDAEVRAALQAVPDGQNPRDYAAVVRAIAALAERGRYDEALAVGKVQRAAIASAIPAGAAGVAGVPEGEASAGGEPGGGLEALMKAVAGRQVASLLAEHRWKEAGAATRTALAHWPGDVQLLALHQQTGTMMAQDPWRLGAWPAAVRAMGALGASTARAGRPGLAPRIPSGGAAKATGTGLRR